MIEVRCIKPIGGFEINDIVDIENGVLMTVNGVAGALIAKDLGEGNRALFVIDDAIDSIGKTIRVQAPESMAKYFSFDTEIIDPEDPDPEANCSLKDLIAPGGVSFTYVPVDDEWELRFVPAYSSPLEFATELQGIAKAGAAIVNVVYYQVPRNSDGTYSVRIANTGNAETVLIRQKGCTSTNLSLELNDFYGGIFTAYRPGDIIDPEPVEGKVTIPAGVIMWDGFFDDYGDSPRNGIGGSPYEKGINQASSLRVDLSEFSGLNVVPFYGEQGLTPETIKIYANGYWNGSENVYDEIFKNVTCKFNKTQTAVDKEIGFLLDAGIDYMAFNYYSPYDSPMGEGLHKFTQSSAMSTMKMCFISGSIGYDIPTNVDYITDCMTSDYYQLIDSRPLIFINNAWISQTYNDTILINDVVTPRQRTILQVIKDDYSSKTGGGQLYVVNLSMGRDYPTENYSVHGMECASIYCTYGVSGNTPRPHSELMADEISLRNAFINNGGLTSYDIIPTISTGFLNLANRSSLAGGDNTNYTEKATLEQMDTKMTDLMTFIASNQSRVPAILFYAGTENHESGNPIIPTLSSGFTSVDVASLNTAGANTGVNRTLLDKVKQYCKL